MFNKVISVIGGAIAIVAIGLVPNAAAYPGAGDCADGSRQPIGRQCNDGSAPTPTTTPEHTTLPPPPPDDPSLYEPGGVFGPQRITAPCVVENTSDRFNMC